MSQRTRKLLAEQIGPRDFSREELAKEYTPKREASPILLQGQNFKARWVRIDVLLFKVWSEH